MPLPNAVITKVFGPPKLIERLTQSTFGSQNILLIGRNSSARGRTAVQLAVDDLIDGAKALARVTGLDVVNALPTRDALMEGLRMAPSVKSVAPNGKVFTNTFYAPPCLIPGVFVVVSTGSARKEDDAESTQPFVDFVQEVIRTHGIVLLFARRVDRLTRNQWAVADLAKALRRTRGLVGCEDRFYDPRDGADSSALFLAAEATERAASAIESQTRDSWVRDTGPVLVDGKVRYPAGRSAFGGICRLRLRGDLNVGHTVLCLESPRWLPARDDVASGYPNVLDPKGEVVDQVENVRWALRMFGEGMPQRDIAKGLVRQRWSTDGLRRLSKDSSMRWGWRDNQHVDEAADTVLRPILGNLSVYEFGELVMPLGIEGFPDLVTRYFAPPDTDEWEDPDVFSAIRLRLGSRTPKPDVLYAFTGLPITVGERHGTLWSQRRLLRVDGETVEVPAYVVKARPGGKREGLAPRTVLDHSEIARAVTDAIANAGELPMDLVPVVVPDRDDEQLIATRDRLRGQFDELQQRTDALVEELLSGRVDGSLRDELNRRYNDDLTPALEQTSVELADAEKALDGLSVAPVATTGGPPTPASGVLDLVASIQDPTDHTYRWRIIAAARDMTLNIEPPVERGAGPTVRLHGSLLLGHDAASYRLPIDRTWTTMIGVDLVARFRDQIAAAGSHLAVLQGERARVRLQRAFVRDGGHLYLSQVDDERIAHVAFEHLAAPDTSARDLAACLGEPVGFVEAVVRVHSARSTRGRHLWRSHPNVVQNLYVVAGANNGFAPYSQVVTQAASAGIESVRACFRALGLQTHWKGVYGKGFRLLVRCRWCGSHDLRVAAIGEPVGLVCAACREDGVGVFWPASYDRYLCPSAG